MPVPTPMISHEPLRDRRSEGILRGKTPQRGGLPYGFGTWTAAHRHRDGSPVRGSAAHPVRWSHRSRLAVHGSLRSPFAYQTTLPPVGSPGSRVVGRSAPSSRSLIRRRSRRSRRPARVLSFPVVTPPARRIRGASLRSAPRYAREGIRTLGPLQERILSPPPFPGLATLARSPDYRLSG